MSAFSIDEILGLIDDELCEEGVPVLSRICQLYAKDFQISPETLRRAYYRRIRSKQQCPIRSRLNRALTDLQEKALVYTCQVFASMNLGIKQKELLLIATNAWKLNLTPRWAHGFLKRHKDEFTVRRCQALCKARNDPDVILPAVRSWIDDLKKYLSLKENAFPAHVIFNFDETRITFNERGIHFRRIVGKNQKKSDLQTTRENGSVTLVSFICADGTVFFSVYIFSEDFQGKSQTEVGFKILHQSKTRTGGWPRYYTFSEKGYLNSDILASIIAEFCDRWNLLHPGLNALIFSDQLASHRDPTIVAMAYEKCVKMYSLVANSSHFLQPCDSIYFAQFKNHLAQNHLDQIRSRALQNESMAEMLIESAYEAEIEASKERIIKCSWNDGGLYPFQPDVICHRANEALGGILGTQCEKVAREAVKHVIDQNKKKKARIVSGRSVVRMNQLCSPESLLQANEALVRSAPERSQLDTCRFAGCKKRNRGGKSWAACSCGRFKLCPQHRKSPLACSCITTSTSASVPSQPTEPTQATELTHDIAPPQPSQAIQPQQPQTCPQCDLLLLDSPECSYCAHRGFTSLPDETHESDTEEDISSDISSGGDQASLDENPEEVFHLVQRGVCEVCGITTRYLNNGRCSRSDCLSFNPAAKRIRKQKKLDF